MNRIAIIENGPSLRSYFGHMLEQAGVEHVTARMWRGARIPDDCDAFIMTGDFHDLTHGLEDYHRSELDFLGALGGRKLFASCFSHQLVALAHGGKIERRDNRLLRWETVRLVAEHPALKRLSNFDAVCLNIEEVVIVPDAAELIGASSGCGCQVLSYSDNILTCQGHPEMAMRRGQGMVNALALWLARGPGAEYREYRASRPEPLPSQSDFMTSVIRWLST
jgi:GMP synthase-like glutamine amidotransferase